MLVKEEISTITKKFDENGKVIESKEEKVIKEYKDDNHYNYDPLFRKLEPLPHFNPNVADLHNFRIK